MNALIEINATNHEDYEDSHWAQRHSNNEMSGDKEWSQWLDVNDGEERPEKRGGGGAIEQSQEEEVKMERNFLAFNIAQRLVSVEGMFLLK